MQISEHHCPLEVGLVLGGQWKGRKIYISSAVGVPGCMHFSKLTSLYTDICVYH